MNNNLEKIKEELQDICPAKRDYTYPIFSNSWSGWRIYSLGPKIIAKGVYKGLIGRTLICQLPPLIEAEAWKKALVD